MSRFKIPPAGITRYYRDQVSQPHGVDYTVRIRKLDELSEYETVLGVIKCALEDCRGEGLDFDELVEHAKRLKWADSEPDKGD